MRYLAWDFFREVLAARAAAARRALMAACLTERQSLVCLNQNFQQKPKSNSGQFLFSRAQTSKSHENFEHGKRGHTHAGRERDFFVQNVSWLRRARHAPPSTLASASARVETLEPLDSAVWGIMKAICFLASRLTIFDVMSEVCWLLASALSALFGMLFWLPSASFASCFVVVCCCACL